MHAPNSTKQPGRPLNKTDLKRLAADYIDEPTATAAQLRRVSSHEAAEQIGRKDSGTLSGILFPYRWPGAADSHLFRLRRDTPDIEHDEHGTRKETGKYLAPAASRNALYFPPLDPADLQNTTTPLIITEGEKKALALWRLATHASRALQFVPIAISGVSNWRGTIGRTTDHNGRPQAEKGAIPDWGRIQLRGRKVIILFDKDASTNPRVRFARFSLSRWLQRQGASVFIADIPADSAQKGIDELTAAQGPAAALNIIDAAKPTDIAAELEMMAAADLAPGEALDLLARLLAPLEAIDYATHRAAVRKQFAGKVSIADLDSTVRARRADYEKRKRTGNQTATPLVYSGKQYEATPAGLVFWRMDRFNNEHRPTYLCNFNARIIADVIKDDGEEKTRALKIAAAVGEQAAEVVISAAEFGRMEWPIEHLGAQANVYPTFRDHCRCAIQTISTDITTHVSYTHIGWSIQDGRAMYLHHNGAIAAGGHVPNLNIDLDRRLSKFALPEPPTNGARRGPIRAALAMLNVAPDTITIPLLGGVFRAALGNVRCSLFLTGQTGCGKSQLAALAQQFYGAEMSAAALPASWDSTANALEAMAHKCKDAIFTIDDFVPKGAAADIARLHQTADRILRAQGNASGRARMNADTTLKSPKVPRGMVLATGEDLPKGHSLRARLVVLEVHPADVQWPTLTQCQADAAAGHYAAALACYLQHVAANLDDERRKIEDLTAAMREELATTGHKRTPDNIASLAAALISFLEFAEEAQAITGQERAAIMERAAAALIAITGSQDKAQEHGEPCAAFCEAIGSALATGSAHISDMLGGSEMLDNPSAYGWRKDPQDINIWRPQGGRIGWAEDDDLYLDPLAAYNIAQKHATTADALQLSLNTLKRRLKQREVLKTIDEARESVTVRRTIDNRRRDVLHFHNTPSLTPENNPTNPTNRHSGPAADAKNGNWSGFFNRAISRFLETRHVSDHNKPNRINSYASMVGLVGLNPEVREVPRETETEPAAIGRKRGRVSENNPTIGRIKNPTRTKTAAVDEVEL